MISLTELDYMILCVLSHGPCSGYEIKKAFADSTTSRLSGSAGAIYPALRRLVTKGVVAAEPVRTKRAHGHNRYSITGAGEAELRDWLTAPPGSDEVSAVYDPLRLRVQMLSLLSPEQQRSVVLGLIEAAERYIKFLRPYPARMAKHKLPEEYQWSIQYAIRMAKARVRWLKEVLGKVSDDHGP